MERRELIKEPYFTVDHWKIRGEVTRAVKVDYLLVSVIEGNGKVTVKEQTYSLQKGDHFIVPTSTDTFSLNGTFELIVEIGRASCRERMKEWAMARPLTTI